jgi:hypothetical protein
LALPEYLVGRRSRRAGELDRGNMFNPDKAHLIGLLVAASIIGSATSPVAAAVHIDGQVQSGGGAVAGSTVTLWAGSAGEPRQLAQAKTGDDGSFVLNADATPGPSVSLYLVAKGGVASINKGAGDNPALSFWRCSAAAPHPMSPSTR